MFTKHHSSGCFFCRSAIYCLCLTPLFLYLSCLNIYNPYEFSSPIIVITFDDAHESVYNFAFPAMRSIDSTWAATHFFPVTYSQTSDSVTAYSEYGGPITIAQIREMELAGWETGGHGYSHTNLSSVPIDTVEFQVKSSYDFFVKNGFCHESFAYPWGNYNDTVSAIVKKYFKNIRTSHDLWYLDGVNRSELGYYAVKSGCSSNDIIARVENARAAGAPLVIIGFHAILPDTAAAIPVYWCRESVFLSFLLYLKKQELQVMTLKKAMNILCP
jgi:peptidoglycan/xylan/chitin deacetylase (PgdA/CDA1 family)